MQSGQPSDESIDTCSKVFNIHTALSRVHGDERIANDVQRADIDLAVHEPKRVHAWVRQQMQLVRRGAVIDELFVPGPNGRGQDVMVGRGGE